MTVCIAAIAYENLLTGRVPLIVTASDQMLGSGLSSSDKATVKLEPFHQDWSAMIAANDLSQCMPIIERAEIYLRGKENTLQRVRSCFKRAYQDHVKEMATDKVLGRYGIDMKEFLKTGKRRFTESKFNSLCDQIDQIEVACTFLIFGYDKKGIPHIFTVENPGSDQVHDKTGYCAIGAGEYAADGMLTYLNQNQDCRLRETIIHVLFSKFMAERVPGVGESTFFFIKKQGRPMFGHVGNIVGEARTAWEKEGCPRVPSGIIQRLGQIGISFFTGGPDTKGETL